jgi:hypothetical protein
MPIALGVLWIFLALLSGAAISAYVWQRRSDYATVQGKGAQARRRVLSPFSAWSIDRDNDA